jgi:hypothetical protein
MTHLSHFFTQTGTNCDSHVAVSVLFIQVKYVSLTTDRLLNIFTFLLRAFAHKQRQSKYSAASEHSGPYREQTGGWRKLRNEDFYNLYYD